MQFINRKKEMMRLDSVAKLPDGGVAVVWGRRRVGKTRLLLEWADKQKGVYYTADESVPALQMKYFAMALDQVLPGFGSVEYPDWTSLLSRLARDAKNEGWRGPLIIDELPYLIAASPDLPSILQRFLDIEAKRAKLVIALCGSSQRMMQGAVLDASAPLYGRADQIIKLGPISVGYIEQALSLKKPKEMIESYSVWGGIPKYWELVRNHGGNLFECIDSLVLDPMGPLNDEPNRLLQEEIPTAVSLRPLLDAIGLGSHRLSEIAARTGQPITSLARPIQRLLDLDLVTRETPYNCNEHHSKRTLYKIKDPFLRFWFDIVASRRSHFAQTSSANRLSWLKANMPPYFATAWEEICRQAVPFLPWGSKASLFGSAGRFWQHGQEAEWDIVSQSIDKDTILIGEAKWTAKAPTEAWIQKTSSNLKSKGIPPIHRDPKSKIRYALFLPEIPQGINLPEDLQLINAADIIYSQRDL